MSTAQQAYNSQYQYQPAPPAAQYDPSYPADNKQHIEPATYQPEPPTYPPPGHDKPPKAKRDGLGCVWAVVGIIASLLGPFAFIISCCVQRAALLVGYGIGYIIQAALAALIILVFKYCSQACEVVAQNSGTTVTTVNGVVTNVSTGSAQNSKDIKDACFAYCLLINYVIIALVILYVIMAIIAFIWAILRSRKIRKQQSAI